VDNEVEMTWKEAVIALSEVMSWYFPEGKEENHEKFEKDKGPGIRILLLRVIFRLVLFCCHAHVQFYGFVGRVSSFSVVWQF
jgi:hypothetical protein